MSGSLEIGPSTPDVGGRAFREINEMELTLTIPTLISNEFFDG